jgi:hypothetical protein
MVIQKQKNRGKMVGIQTGMKGEVHSYLYTAGKFGRKPRLTENQYTNVMYLQGIHPAISLRWLAVA